MDENQLQEILHINAMDEIDLTNTSLKQELIDEIKTISPENTLEDTVKTDM